jgi:cytochrome c oxidase subunit 1
MSVCAICLGLAQLIFLANFALSLFRGARAGRNPWESNTLEWTAPSPPPHGNFEKVPIVVRGPYEYADPSYPEGEDHAMQATNLPDEHAPREAQPAPVHA